jgi:hypothetical protein
MPDGSAHSSLPLRAGTAPLPKERHPHRLLMAHCANGGADDSRFGFGSAPGSGGVLDASGVLALLSRNPWRDWTPPGAERQYPCRVPTLRPVHSCLPCTPGAGPPPRKRPPHRLLLALCSNGDAKRPRVRLRLRSCIQGEILSPAGFDTPLLQDGSNQHPRNHVKVKIIPLFGPRIFIGRIAPPRCKSNFRRAWMPPTMPVHEISSFSL